MSEDSLYHHGIKGQRWGVRRFEKAGGGLTAAGKKRYETDDDGNYKKIGNKAPASKSGDGDDEQKKKGLTDKQKKVLIAGAAVVGTSLAAYGGYKLYQLNKEAKEGISTQLHEAALKKFVESNKNLTRSNDFSNPNRSKALYNLSATQRDMGKYLQERAKNKDYSVKDKVEYLRDQRAASKTFNTKAKTNIGNEINIRRHNSALDRRDANKETRIQKMLEPYSKFEDSYRILEKNANNYNERLQKTLNTMKSMSSNTIDVSKTGDDLVQELLRKNALRL